MTMPKEGNTGKMMTRRTQAPGRVSVMLTYSTEDANALRKLAQEIRIKGDRKPSLSLIARRSLGLYLDRLRDTQTTRPGIFAAEVAALERMVTPVPKPAPRSRKATP